MATYSARLGALNALLPVRSLLRGLPRHRASFFLIMTGAALLAFELFNFGTTDFALFNLLGDLRFGSLRWSTVLALAFCGMDFAGIARLFSPQDQRRQILEVWYLLGAWLLAASMNALLTWWAVTLALVSHPGLGNEVIPRETLLAGAPIFVALLVWLIRVLVIGSLVMASDRFDVASESTASPLVNHQEKSAVSELRPVILRRRSPSHPFPAPAALKGHGSQSGQETSASAHRSTLR